MADLIALLQEPHAWASLLTLTTMEIVLGVDNLVFIAILTGRLPPEQQSIARRIGLGLALIMRLGLLSVISWIMHLTEPVFSPGIESLDVALFSWDEIPWDELAFPSVVWGLNQFREIDGQGPFSPFTNPAGETVSR